jgi:hypothetical protein
MLSGLILALTIQNTQEERIQLAITAPKDSNKEARRRYVDNVCMPQVCVIGGTQNWECKMESNEITMLYQKVIQMRMLLCTSNNANYCLRTGLAPGKELSTHATSF